MTKVLMSVVSALGIGAFAIAPTGAETAALTDNTCVPGQVEGTRGCAPKHDGSSGSRGRAEEPTSPASPDPDDPDQRDDDDGPQPDAWGNSGLPGNWDQSR